MRLIDADAMKADLLTVDPQYETMIQWCITVLDAQPTIEPERKTGEWIGTEYDGYADGNSVYYEWKCSKCGCIIEEEGRPTYNYCPQCGAYMRGEANADD